MIFTTRTVKTITQTSNCILEDIIVPLSKRNGFFIRKFPVIPVHFCIYIGIKENKDMYYQELTHLDKRLMELGSLYLKFIKPIPFLFCDEISNATSNLWEQLTENISKNQDNTYTLYNANNNTNIFPPIKCSTLYISLVKAFSDVLTLFVTNSKNANTTLVRNLGLKLLNWIHKYVPSLLSNFSISNIKNKEIHNPKVLFYGDIKEHEAYFLILLSKLGIDVLYINTMGSDIIQNIDKNHQYSYVCKLSHTEPLKEFPQFKPQQPQRTQQPQQKSNINIMVQPINNTPLQPKKAEGLVGTPYNVNRIKKTLEELAQLSNSTVMIRTYDRKGKPLGSGSGVVIDTNGLIVTNHHVIDGGCYFGVVFEGMDANSQYETYTVINKNRDKDLALIKLPIKTTPIVISRGEDVVRGQKVVAIGSPLGLMNTFSEGIISGFRKSQKCAFIQTTAPMSPGSSGGALLNMYGELIGVASAGYVDGQNINLAIPSKYILDLLDQKSTKISMELIEMYSTFTYDNIRVNFDALFSSSIVGSYNILFYQSRSDKTNLLELLKNRNFSNKLENHYISCISNLMYKHSIQAYEFELGTENYVFTYSYRKGEIKNKGWEYVKL